MAMPSGAIQVGGTTPPEQRYDLDSIDSAAYTYDKVMHVYLACRLPWWPTWASTSGGAKTVVKTIYGLHQSVPADQVMTVEYRVHHSLDGRTKTTGSGAAGAPDWVYHTGELITLTSEQIKRASYSWDELWASIRISFRYWTTDVAADTYVDGVYLKHSHNFETGIPIVAVPKTNADKRVYAPNHFGDAYLATKAICDTLNTYVEQSTMLMCCPIFGNVAS